MGISWGGGGGGGMGWPLAVMAESLPGIVRVGACDLACYDGARRGTVFV